MNPLWNTVVVGGMQNGEPFLGVTDKIGVAYVENTIATGYGAHIALVRWRGKGADGMLPQACRRLHQRAHTLVPASLQPFRSRSCAPRTRRTPT